MSVQPLGPRSTGKSDEDTDISSTTEGESRVSNAETSAERFHPEELSGLCCPNRISDADGRRFQKVWERSGGSKWLLRTHPELLKKALKWFSDCEKIHWTDKTKKTDFFVLHPEHQLWRKPVTAHHLRGGCKGLKLLSISWDFDSKHHSSCDSDFRVQEVKTPDYFLNSAFMGRQLCYGQTRVTTENLNKCRRVLKHLV